VRNKYLVIWAMVIVFFWACIFALIIHWETK
jgi:hypothetical protein